MGNSCGYIYITSLFALKTSLCETDSPDTGEVARSARGGERWPKAGGRELCGNPKYFGPWQGSLPHRLRAEPPPRGGQENYSCRLSTVVVKTDVPTGTSYLTAGMTVLGSYRFVLG